MAVKSFIVQAPALFVLSQLERRPPCTNQFRLARFYIENITYLFYKTSYLYEEVNCTEPFPSVSIPWLVPYHLSKSGSQSRNYKDFCAVIYSFQCKTTSIYSPSKSNLLPGYSCSMSNILSVSSSQQQ